eukprot:gene40238-5771_t
MRMRKKRSGNERRHSSRRRSSSPHGDDGARDRADHSPARPRGGRERTVRAVLGRADRGGEPDRAAPRGPAQPAQLHHAHHRSDGARPAGGSGFDEHDRDRIDTRAIEQPPPDGGGGAVVGAFGRDAHVVRGSLQLNGVNYAKYEALRRG